MTVDYDGIIIIDAYSGIPLFSKIKNIDDTLFSGFITAIRKFSEELSLGSLSSFSTDEKHIFLVAREKIVVAIITDIKIEFQKIYSFASKLAYKFEDKYDLENVSEVSIFDEFISDLNEIENEKTIPFKVKVAEFVSKEMGSKIGLDVNLNGNDGNEHTIDIIVDNGQKSVGRLRDKRLRKMVSAFSSDIIFVKIIDGTAGKAETIDFINSMKLFGAKSDEKDVFAYFPSKAVIIAKEYSPTVIEELKNYPKKQNRIFIAGSHITQKSNLKISPDSSKCFIELWQWFDDKYPERILN